VARKQLDAVDLMCQLWAQTRRELLGLREPSLASQYLGAMRSTLASVKEMHDGTDSGQLKQHFPEVYTGRSFWVNQGFNRLPPHLKAVVDAHYTLRAPMRRAAPILGVGRPTYAERLALAKGYIEGYVNANERD